MRKIKKDPCFNENEMTVTVPNRSQTNYDKMFRFLVLEAALRIAMESNESPMYQIGRKGMVEIINNLPNETLIDLAEACAWYIDYKIGQKCLSRIMEEHAQKEPDYNDANDVFEYERCYEGVDITFKSIEEIIMRYYRENLLVIIG
jgi:hypothetical protein